MTAATLAPEWELFADWCESLGIDAIPATTGMVVEFLRELPASRPVQARRVRAIQEAHAAADASLTTPRVWAERPDMWRAADGLVGPREAIAQMPKYRWPLGLVGRRDAFLVVLTGILGLSREQARAVGAATGSVLILGSTIRIEGKSVPRGDDAGSCPACAAARWLDVIAPHYLRGRPTYVSRLDPTAALPNRHDCERPIDMAWEDGVLLPGIDRWGAVAATPLSTRAISTIVASRRVRTGFEERTGPRVPAPNRLSNFSMGELAEEQDALMAHIDAMNRQLEAVLAEAGGMRDRIKGFGDIPG